MDKIKIHDKVFKPYINYEELDVCIENVARKLDADFAGKGEVPVFLCVFNGAIMFTAELMKRVSFQAEIMSMKVSSYEGTNSTGKVKVLSPLTGDVRGKSVIICEDIVDTGRTIIAMKQYLRDAGAKDVRVCTMLSKPGSYDKSLTLDYVGKEIENDFIVGFGLDYDELGRTLKDIYVIDNQ